jgi:hypothetical protein
VHFDLHAVRILEVHRVVPVARWFSPVRFRCASGTVRRVELAHHFVGTIEHGDHVGGTEIVANDVGEFVVPRVLAVARQRRDLFWNSAFSGRRSDRLNQRDNRS